MDQNSINIIFEKDDFKIAHVVQFNGDFYTWRDNCLEDGQSYGPYQSLHQLFHHYTKLKAEQKAAAQTMAGKVVMVDFQKRKRISGLPPYPQTSQIPPTIA